jgi:hypothetical protein
MMKKRQKTAKIANFVFFCHCCRQSATLPFSASSGAFFPYAPTPLKIVPTTKSALSKKYANHYNIELRIFICQPGENYAKFVKFG